MKRGSTKRRSQGQSGQEQKEDRDRINSINWHLKQGNMSAAMRLLNKTPVGREAIMAKIRAEMGKEALDAELR